MHSAPTSPTEPNPSLDALRRRFGELLSLCVNPDVIDLTDLELWEALDDHLRHGGDSLDLGAHGDALGRVPDELMEVFFEARRLMVPALRTLHLPPGWDARAQWLGACPATAVLI